MLFCNITMRREKDLSFVWVVWLEFSIVMQQKEKDFWRSSLLLTSFQQEERKQGDAELQLGIKAHDVLWNQLIKTAYKLFWSFSNIIADYLRKNVVPLRFHPDKTRLLVVEMSHDDVYSCFFFFYHFWQTIVLS